MTTPRLKEKYKSEIVAKLEKELGISNINNVPRLQKIVVNMGVGAAASDHKLLDAAMNDMRIITGQQPCVRLSAARSPFVATACGNSSTAFCPPRFLAFATSAASPAPASTAAATTRSASPSS